jgi:hypothetical protein
VRWTFKDVFGTFKIIETRAYYIPGAGVRLFSPQVYFQEQQAGSYLMTSTNAVLTTADGCLLTLGYQLGSNLPMVPPPAVCALMAFRSYLWNHLPRSDTRLAPQELYTSSLFVSYDHLARLHMFGCPIYVLHPRLQDGHTVPKWKPLARRGQFLGYSPEHSSSIGLILNTTTGKIIPQYHVVHGDYFTTVPSVYSTKTFDAVSWKAILQTGVERYLLDDIDRFGKPLPLPSLHDKLITEEEQCNNAQPSKRHGPQPQREHFDVLPELPLSESQRERTPPTAPSETMRVPRSSQREFGSDNGGGGGSIFGDRDGSPPRSQPPLPRIERPPATPLHLDFDDDVPVSRPSSRVPANEGLGRGMRRRRANSNELHLG